MPAPMSTPTATAIGVSNKLTTNPAIPPANASPAVSSGPANNGESTKLRMPPSRAEINAQINAKINGFTKSPCRPIPRKKATGWVTRAVTVLTKLPTGSWRLNSPPGLPAGPRGVPRAGPPVSPPYSGRDSSSDLPPLLPVLKSIRLSSLRAFGNRRLAASGHTCNTASASALALFELL